MQLSQESYRTRWIVLVSVWAIAAASLFTQARIVRDYLRIVNELGLRGSPAAMTPMKQPFPAFAADAQVWVRHALALLEGDKVQLRYTTIDNAPKGREVHWNSAWAWTIAGAGKVYQLFTGESTEASVEKATIWLNPTVMLALTVLLSAWATRRAGLIAGVVVAVAMISHDRIYEGFFPSYVDHHGLLTVSVLAMVFGAICMGGGWWQERPNGALPVLPDSAEEARRAATFSALSGACGLWVSAASTIPPVAITGIAGLVAVFVHGAAAQKQGARFAPDVWRHWGRVGAGASFVFFLVEYFPSHLFGLRLESNHPFHALAWLAGGELIAQIGERWLGSPAERFAKPQTLIWPLVAVALTPATIVIGGVRVFAVIDPFMSRLHNDYIQEFLPIWRTLRSFDASAAIQLVFVGSLPLILAVATLSFRRRESPIVLWFATIAAFFFTVLAWWQSRWLLNSTGIQISLAVLLLGIWTASARNLVRWAVALGMISVLFLPSLVNRYRGSSADVAARRVAPKDATSVLNRDIAAALRASQPQGDLIVLASPNASTGIGYYGRFKTLGTLYWENTEGLKAAAGIWGARSDDEAAKLIKERGVTHIALVADENFIEQYFQLLHPKATAAEARQCFGLRLMLDRTIPQWLQMIPYKIPDDLTSLKPFVMLFKVNFNQNIIEAMYNAALALIAQDAIDDAEKTLDAIIAQAPQAYQPWLRKGEILLARRKFDAAAEHLLKGASLAPAAEKTAIYSGTAGSFYNQRQHGHAARLYLAGLAHQFDPNIAAYLSWILGTTPIDSLRNGKDALALAEAALKVDPNSPVYLNAQAAALAELGRFPEAVTAEEAALANAKLRGDANLTRDSESRLALFRAGNPLRK